MKILITGNLGYVGSVLTKNLRKRYPEAELIGFDAGYFARNLTTPLHTPEVYLDKQVYGDVRSFPAEILDGVDTVIQLAAVSNDPIGNKFEEITLDVNHKAVVDIAKKAKERGVKRVVFASSCSVYGIADKDARSESSDVNPLTAYARSKVFSERDLKPLADDNFMVTCLRFATACGMSQRLRLDLVLNDFVAGASATDQITILSDGSPWRPLINVHDMSRALMWGHERSTDAGGNYLVVNTGSNRWNYQIRDLAYSIKESLPHVDVSINQNALPDKRSYKVDFGLYEKLAPQHQPEYELEQTIKDLSDGLKAMDFNDPDFRESDLIRLHVVNKLIEQKVIDQNLFVIR
ncbi:MAG: SDR family oxidoreductase [Bacteroidetes bacterium]|nr:SDR family oxidoreductase [Bacteroidota bacterium]